MYRTTAAMGIIVPEMKSTPQCPRHRLIPLRDCAHQRIHQMKESGPAGCGQSVEMEL
jgi:hypothetical protein